MAVDHPGPILASKVIHKVEPAYPDRARRARISGVVITILFALK
jgi:outer membrane biosynthesis protein TonB